MSIFDLFRKDKTNEYATYNLTAVEGFFLESKQYLNPKDGPDFVSGIRGAYIPVSTAVARAVGRQLEYGDTLRKYCELTANNPDELIRALMKLSSAMKPAPASGVRFLVGQLILHYYAVGAFKEDSLFNSVVKQLTLTEEGIIILKAFSQYG
jgi:hypothetical protein